MSERKLENPGDESLGSVDVSELIATRAHEIFQSRGGEQGRDLDDWLQAEREVLAAQSEATLLSPAAEQQLAATASAATGQATNEVQGSEPSARGGKKR
jgi:3-oxoacyl-ACP reductase-like protein